MTIIKICGITNEGDRDMVLSEGADLIGFNVFKGSKRYLSYESLKNLLIPHVRNKSVLIDVNRDYNSWMELIEVFQPAYIQLHGEESIDMLKKLKRQVSEIMLIKKVTIEQDYKFPEVLKYADYILCDTQTDSYGGSGKTFNWDQLEDLDREIKDRMIIAGGINPDNIDELLGYDVFGIDVASGSEEYPGKKDMNKIRSIIEKVKEYAK